MIIRETNLGQTEESKRRSIEENLGQQVILNDSHNGWCHGVLLEKDRDRQTYHINIADARKERRLHYHDLNQLLVINNDSVYSRPDLD